MRKPPAFLLLFLASLFATSMVVVRWRYSGQLFYLFLIWNLFLAWLPLLAAWLAVRVRRTPLLLVAVTLIWLLFLPNAPYLLTDLMHLGRAGGAPLWYDLIMLLAFAVTGIFLGFISLAMMQEMIDRSYGRLAGWVFASSGLILSSLGVFLGRFLRWNSWDIFLQPTDIAADILGILVHPLLFLRAIVFILLLATVLFFFYAVLRIWTQLTVRARFV